jgi:hypothetical protein
MKARVPLQDVPIVDLATGLANVDWYDFFKRLETLGLLDMAVIPPTTVAQLPAAGKSSSVNFVTDATVTTFASIVVGGGTNKVPIYDDGTNWRIG